MSKSHIFPDNTTYPHLLSSRRLSAPPLHADQGRLGRHVSSIDFPRGSFVLTVKVILDRGVGAIGDRHHKKFLVGQGEKVKGNE